MNERGTAHVSEMSLTKSMGEFETMCSQAKQDQDKWKTRDFGGFMLPGNSPGELLGTRVVAGDNRSQRFTKANKDSRRSDRNMTFVVFVPCDNWLSLTASSQQCKTMHVN